MSLDEKPKKGKEPYTEEDLRKMMGSVGSGFTPMSEIPVDKLDTYRADLLPTFQQLWDLAVSNKGEGSGFNVKVKLGPFEAYAGIEPQVIRYSGGGRSRAQQEKPAFDKAKAQEVVQESPDLLSWKEEGGKVVIQPKKFLGDLWGGYNDKLKGLGMTWGKLDPNDVKSGAWTGREEE